MDGASDVRSPFMTVVMSVVVDVVRCGTPPRVPALA